MRALGRGAQALCVSVLALASAQAGARCTAHDAWRGEDKQLHAIAGATLAAAYTLQTGSAWKGFVFGAAIGVIKEAIDATGSGTCSVQDAAVTVAGAALGAQFGRIGLRLQRGGASIAYATTF